MGLDELVNNNSSKEQSSKSESKKKSKSKTKSETSSNDKTSVGGQKTLKRSSVSDKRPSKVHVKEDRSAIDCMDCGDCSKGTKAPVVGVAEDMEGNVDFGSLMICDNIFCDSSIFDVRDPPLEFDRMEIHEEIVDTTGGPGMSSW
jgi:hypothetical protein